MKQTAEEHLEDEIKKFEANPNNYYNKSRRDMLYNVGFLVGGTALAALSGRFAPELSEKIISAVYNTPTQEITKEIVVTQNYLTEILKFSGIFGGVAAVAKGFGNVGHKVKDMMYMLKKYSNKINVME